MMRTGVLHRPGSGPRTGPLLTRTYLRQPIILYAAWPVGTGYRAVKATATLAYTNRGVVAQYELTTTEPVGEASSIKLFARRDCYTSREKAEKVAFLLNLRGQK